MGLLRDRQLLDFKFRRQHPLGSYILDFYCYDVKLAIELDGGQHAEDAQLKHDEKRSAWLKAQGITVLRFLEQRGANEYRGAFCKRMF